MSVARLPNVTVTVEDSGKVWIGDTLVAEVAAGQVDGRDDLERSLTLHRIASTVHTTLRDCRHALDTFDKDADRHLIGEGVADGLAGVRDPSTLFGHATDNEGNPTVPDVPRRHEPEYRVGLQVGEMLAAMLVHLDREDGDG